MNAQDLSDALIMAAEINDAIARAIAGGAEVVLRPQDGAIEVVAGEASEVIALGESGESAEAPEGEVVP